MLRSYWEAGRERGPGREADMVVAKGGVKVLRMLRIVGAVLWQSWGWSCVRGRRCGQRRSKCLALLIDDWKALRYRAINSKEFLYFGIP